MKKTLLFIILFLLKFYSYSQNTIKISELDLTKSWQEFGAVQKGKTVDGQIAKIKNHTYTDVIGVHAKSIITIDLKKDALIFKAKIALSMNRFEENSKSNYIIPLVDGSKLLYEDTDGKKQFLGLSDKTGKIATGNVKFRIEGDNKELFNSGDISLDHGVIDVSIAIKGIKVLSMIVEPTSDGPSGDHALWIDPTIEYIEKKPEMMNPGYIGQGRKMSESTNNNLKNKLAALPIYEKLGSIKTPFDWLLTPEKSKSGIYASKDLKDIIIGNEMVSRRFRLFPNIATVELTNHMIGEQLIRAASPEGRITIDGKQWSIGGLSGQVERGYLRSEWLDDLVSTPESFSLEDFEIRPLKPKINWTPSRWASNKKLPEGQEIVFTLRGDKEVSDIYINLIFSIYDHIPVIGKRMEVINKSKKTIQVDYFQLELLAFSEPESLGGGDPRTFRLPNIHVESDYAAAGKFTEKETDITEKWIADPAYTSQRNYLLQTPCILEVSPELGPGQSVGSSEGFKSFTVYEMPFDSDDRERKGLFTRRMYRTIAPWTTENPIFMHLTSTDPEVVKRAIDQCDSTGYEMIILSFGSGLNAEDTTAANIEKYRKFVEYANSKGIDMGCYSLLASRWISEEVDVINPKTGKRGGMTFGSSPCLASDWGYEYFDKIKYFFENTGMKCFEHDGSYPGDFCASTAHAHHKGLEDSQWNQFNKITELYHWMSKEGIYMNVPDFYFLNGSNKVGIGYREVNWSLTRAQQIIHARQLNYDSTWERIPSSVWSFVPLVEYQGGGNQATLEPLQNHLYEYEMHMIQNYGAGIQACYRGPRLYDSPETKNLVVETINWYKKYRNILNSDIIHLRKPDAKDWDGMMHINPDEKEKGFALFYNPLDEDIERTIKLPLYYTGIENSAFIRVKEGEMKKYDLDRQFQVEIKVNIPANGYSWLVIEQ